MRNRWMSAGCLCFALAFCPTIVRGAPPPESVDDPVSPSPTPPDMGVELEWWVIDLGGGVSASDGLVLFGAVADLSEEPFAVLKGFDAPHPAETRRAIEEPMDAPVTELALAPISPNPNRGVARVSWALPSESRVRVTIHDIQGREVVVLADGPYPPGRHEVAWSAGRRGSGGAGMYFVRLQTPQRTLVRRMVVIR